jgi:hypothetical protein
MNDVLIGLWVARFTKNVQVTKWHLCETLIEDRKYTRCGRAMREIPGTSIVPVVTPPTIAVTCKQCNPQA